MTSLPTLTLPRTDVAPNVLPAAPWPDAATVSLVRSTDGGPPSQPTTVHLIVASDALWVRFHCTDRDAWGTHTVRDAPLWEEEAVEIFLAPLADDGPPSPFPPRYVEIEASPRGTLFDAVVHNPTGERRGMSVDAGWDLPGLEARVVPAGIGDDWTATLRLPWVGLLAAFPGVGSRPPRRWRANLYRIERPRDGDDEFTAWSPTLADPPDFHRPARFGWLVVAC